jgi:hypothetical protein
MHVPLDIALFVIVLAAALTTGVTGFGFNLVSVPLLALYLDARSAVVVSLVLGVFASALLLIPADVRSHIDRRIALLLFGFSLLGLPIGVLLFTVASPTLLKLAIGLITVAYAAPLLWSNRARSRGHLYLGAVAGFVGGVLASSTGLSGPPAIVFAHSRGLQPATLRATLAAYVLLVTLVTLPLLAMTGWLNSEKLSGSVLLIPAVLVGVFVGRALFHRLPMHIFQRIVVLSLVVMGVANLVAAALSR